MPITLTYGGGVIAPALVLGYETTRRARNVIHTILDSAAPAVTLRPASLRSGRLEMFFLTHDPAIACEAAHAQPTVFTLIDTDHPANGMRYVASGEVSVEQVGPDLNRWTVTVAYQEVLL